MVETKKGKFYRRVYEGEAENVIFQLKPLLLLSTLLGKGGSKDKASDLFDFFDGGMSMEKTGKLETA